MKLLLKVKHDASDLTASLGGWRACLPLALALVMLMRVAEAQTDRSLGAENEEQPPEDSSQQVDESDESYRQRMELRDGFPNQQTRIETTYSSPASNAKIDQLPAPSQKHIKDQLREMIITEGQWEPGEDLSDYPYEPSPAAQTDSQLRGKEREAWSEELQKYQEREAAAYAQATGQSPTESAEQGTAGQQGQPGAENGERGEKGQQGSSGSSSSQDSATAAAERRARAEQAAAAYQGGSRNSEEAVSTAGVSESALSYLQSMNGGSASTPPGGSPQQASGEDGEQQDSGEQSAHAAGQESAQEAGQDAAQQAAQMAAAESKTESGEATEESAEQETDAENLAGTLAVGDLQNMYAESGQGASASAATGKQEITYRDVKTEMVIEPGTLTIEELRKLDGYDSEGQ